MTRHRPLAGARWTILIAAGALLLPPARGDDLKRLIDEIAKGDEAQSADAAAALVERVVGPLVEALGSLEQRPLPEQVRLRGALNRVTAGLRLRVFRADLTDGDRRLFDEFARRYGQLVEKLFDDDPEVRIRALEQVPLEPNSGAGVLVIGKVNDWDGTVAEHAFEIAAALRDDVVSRGLTRYVRDATAVLKSGFYGPESQDVALVVAVFIVKASKVIGLHPIPEATAEVVSAFEYLARSPYRPLLDLADLADALGALGDERGAAVLTEQLAEDRIRRNQPTDDGRLLTQTVGDAMLLALLRIYKLEPATFGIVAAGEGALLGFPSVEARRAGHAAFMQWYRDNARLPATQRKAPSSQPSKP